MPVSRRLFATLLVGSAAALAGCGSSTLTSGTVVVDVRTPAEYDSGHLEGAVNIDLEASTFATKIAALDKNATYFVYCRSGNRSSQAVAAMKKIGFTHVTDGGGISAAGQSSGLKTVTP